MSEQSTGSVADRDVSVFSPAARQYALGVLVVVYTFNFIDRQILSILLQPIKDELGLSDSALGLLTGFAFALFYATLGIPIARYADRGNRRSLIALALAIWSAMTALSGLAQNFWQLLAARPRVRRYSVGSPLDLSPSTVRWSARNIRAWQVPRWCYFIRRRPSRRLLFLRP